MTAKELSITSWEREEGDRRLMLSVPGIKLTAWFPQGPSDITSYQSLKTIWPTEAASVLVELDILEDLDGKQHQVCAYVRLREFPNGDWNRVLSESLKYFVDYGGAIAWAGGWECFLHYSPDEAFTGCYAAYTALTGYVCFSELNGEVIYLDRVPGAVAQLHSAVARAIKEGQ